MRTSAAGQSPHGWSVESAGGVTVHVADIEGLSAARHALVELDLPARLMAMDPSLWGDAAAELAATRLGWVDAVRVSRQSVLPLLGPLREACAGMSHVVLAGMGGSSLAPEVICRTLGRGLTVLDTTDPGQIRGALTDRLDRTIVVISSKSGTTVETDSIRRLYLDAFSAAGLSDVARRFVVVTDPGTPLEQIGREMGAPVILADPDVGGRYSALTAFGLVPAALAGVDVAELLDAGGTLAKHAAQAADNPALALASAMIAGCLNGRTKIALVDDGTGITGFGDWAEQLVAESTGKDGKGILPIVVETPSAPNVSGETILTVTIGGSLLPATVPGSGVVPHVAVNGNLGAHFVTWEAAVAMVSHALGVNSFDEPNVTESKENTARILAEGLPAEDPDLVEGAIEVYGAAGVSTVEAALRGLLDRVGADGYLAVMAYLDRIADNAAGALRSALAIPLRRPVTFGWGPRFLHSTGQYHKGGPQNGTFLQVTGEVTDDLAVPGRPYTFGVLQAAQAAGDRQALAQRGRPVLRLHLVDRMAGLAQLLGTADTL